MKAAAWTIAAACAIDALLGDPAWLPHPVRVIGALVTCGDQRLNARGRGSRSAGAVLALAVIGIAAAGGAIAARWPVSAVGLAAAALAARNLLDEAAAVADALEADDIVRARRRVARIVGRDTAELDPAEVARAAIETLAESACDGIIAPLFWLTVCGVPGAQAFKAASTLDSMIGHREPRYRRFGAFAARTDDALNFVPARITALLIALTGGAPRRALLIALRDARHHTSPNAGWPEAALAGALGVRLGGSNRYAGVPIDGAFLNAGGRAPNAADVRTAIGTVARTTLLANICAVAARA